MIPFLKRLYSVLIPILLILWGCGTDSGNNSDVAVINRSQPAVEEGHRLASCYDPRESAGALIRWMLTAGPEDREYARELTAVLTAEYDVEASPLFEAAIDSLCNEQTPADRARLYIMATTPVALAAALAQDPDAGTDSLRNEIIRQYISCGDTAAMNLFNRAYQYISTREKNLSPSDSQ